MGSRTCKGQRKTGKLALAVCMHSHGPGAGRASPVFGKGPVGLLVGPVLSEMRLSRHFPLSIGQNQCEQCWTAGATSSRGLLCMQISKWTRRSWTWHLKSNVKPAVHSLKAYSEHGALPTREEHL